MSNIIGSIFLIICVCSCVYSCYLSELTWHSSITDWLNIFFTVFFGWFIAKEMVSISEHRRVRTDVLFQTCDALQDSLYKYKSTLDTISYGMRCSDEQQEEDYKEFFIAQRSATCRLDTLFRLVGKNLEQSQDLLKEIKTSFNQMKDNFNTGPLDEADSQYANDFDERDNLFTDLISKLNELKLQI